MVAIGSTGNVTDFGDLSVARQNLDAVSSNTRSVFAGGTSSNVIDYVTTASTGNASDFGDLTTSSRFFADCSMSTKITGFFFSRDNIDGEKITIASTGNAADSFSDLADSDFIQVAETAGLTGVHGGLA